MELVFYAIDLEKILSLGYQTQYGGAVCFVPAFGNRALYIMMETGENNWTMRNKLLRDTNAYYVVSALCVKPEIHPIFNIGVVICSENCPWWAVPSQMVIRSVVLSRQGYGLIIHESCHIFKNFENTIDWYW